VTVANQGSTTTITIRASGAFTHTEYRPADNLLMVDLAGVSADKLDGKSEALQAPGVSSYRVIGFKGNNGRDVARVELSVAADATVKFSDTQGGVQVRVLNVMPPASQAVLQTVAMNTAEEEDEPVTPHKQAKLEQPVHVRNIGVQRGPEGMEIQISASGPMKPEAMKLENPDRIVVDLPNASWDRAPRQIPVKADDVKDVRLALYQLNPPVTRVVVDLQEAKDYELVPAANGLRVRLRAARTPASQPAQPVMIAAATPPPEIVPPAPASAPAPVKIEAVPKPVAQSQPIAAPAPAVVETVKPAPAPASEAKRAPAAAVPAPAPVVTASKSAPAPVPAVKPKATAPAPAAVSIASKPEPVKLEAPSGAPASKVEKPAAAPVAVAKLETPAPAPAAITTTSKPDPLKAEAHAPAPVAKVEKPADAPAPAQVASKPEPVKAKAPAVVKAETGASTPASVAKVETPAPVPVAPDAKQPEAAAAQPPANAQDYVLVQPSYKPKTEEPKLIASAAPAPAMRAADAASKFESQGPQVAMAASTQAGSNMQAAATSVPQAPAPAPQPQPPQQQRLNDMTQPRPRYTGEPISVNLKDVDLKDFFRLIHEISGLNVVLDPNVHGTLTIVLDDVPWDQALDIVLKNNGLDRELDGNVLRIATIDTLRREADARRAQIEAKALADPKITVTRFLSYAHSKDVVPIVKRFLSQRGEIISDDRTNGLIIQDIPSVFPEIDRLLVQLDRKTPEVEIEARVVAATRNFAREIGVQLGFAFGNGSSSVGGAPALGPSPIGNLGPPNTTSKNGPAVPYVLTQTTTAIPLFSNLAALAPTSGLALTNVGANYRVDTILTLAESKGLLKILSRPRVVTQNNIQAIVRQGVRIPVTTLSQLGGPATTTYIDAFLRLTVTPQITIENTIFLNVDVENTTPDFGHVAPQTGNPTLLTQQATTQVLVTDGGTVVIGGVIQTNNSVNVAQVPLLGSIPALGNLFKRRSVSTQTQELFFFITPKIIQT
jgi:type IV pilus assembly protein PilQ